MESILIMYKSGKKTWNFNVQKKNMKKIWKKNRETEGQRVRETKMWLARKK